MATDDNSRPLDVHRWSDHPEVNIFVYKLWDDEFARDFPKKRGNQPKTNPKYQFKVLILDLYIAWKQDPSLKLGVGMSKRFYTASSRYNALHISSIMIKLVSALKSRKYIDKKTGSEISGKVTRIWPTPKLIKLFKLARFSEFDIGVSDDYEVIILNKKDGDTGKAKPIEYADSDYDEIPQMRQDLQRYNALLQDTFIDIGSLESPVVKKEYWDSRLKKHRYHKVHIRQNNKLVRRIFYRGSWEIGGRFHGNYCQQINSSYRRDILINDQRTIEVDYSGLHISLIYCIEGQSPPDDPYDLPLQLPDYDAAEQRKVVKGLVLVAINAKSRTAAYQAYRDDQTSGSREKSLKNDNLEILLDAFIEHNPVVENYIGQDKGVELMKLDGDITAIIINHFTRDGIPVLTIHDSYIVPADKVGELKSVMQEAVSKVLANYNIRVTQEVHFPSNLQAFAALDPLGNKYHTQNFTYIPEPIRCDGYIERRDHFYKWRQQSL